VLALTIALPVVLLVVIPGLILAFGLGRAAGKRAPRPGDAQLIHGPLPQIAGQLRLFGTRGMISRRQASAECD
jgi:hypothetical protein